MNQSCEKDSGILCYISIAEPVVSEDVFMIHQYELVSV